MGRPKDLMLHTRRYTFYRGMSTVLLFVDEPHSVIVHRHDFAEVLFVMRIVWIQVIQDLLELRIRETVLNESRIALFQFFRDAITE